MKLKGPRLSILQQLVAKLIEGNVLICSIKMIIFSFKSNLKPIYFKNGITY